MASEPRSAARPRHGRGGPRRRAPASIAPGTHSRAVYHRQYSRSQRSIWHWLQSGLSGQRGGVSVGARITARPAAHVHSLAGQLTACSHGAGERAEGSARLKAAIVWGGRLAEQLDSPVLGCQRGAGARELTSDGDLFWGQREGADAAAELLPGRERKAPPCTAGACGARRLQVQAPLRRSRGCPAAARLTGMVLSRSGL